MTLEVEKQTITLAQLVRSYLISRRHLSPHTQDYYQTCLRNFLWYAQRVGWPEDASAITRDDIREFLNYVSQTKRRWGYKDESRARPASPATVHHYGRVLKRMFRWASDEEEYLPENGIWRLKLAPARYRQVEPYTDGEVMAMLDACEDEFQVSRFRGSRNKAIIAIFADTGIRLSELAGITLADLHSELKQVKVLGKGKKVRVVPLQRESTKALNRYLNYRPRVKSDWLWLSEEGGRLEVQSIKVMVQRLKKRAGVGGDGCVHRFRHYFATRYLEAGGNPSSLRLLLGHESFAMVLHYTKMVSVHRAVEDHEQFSPLNNLYQGRGHRPTDGWGFRY